MGMRIIFGFLCLLYRISLQHMLSVGICYLTASSKKKPAGCICHRREDHCVVVPTYVLSRKIPESEKLLLVHEWYLCIKMHTHLTFNL